MHYCGASFERINFFMEDKGCCPDGEEMPGCCDDIPKADLQNADQSMAKIATVQFWNLSLLPLPHLLSDILLCLAQQEEVPSVRYISDSAPPQSIPIYIEHQIFLI
ncbi:hypothetical protein [Echinicola sediminis]